MRTYLALAAVWTATTPLTLLAQPAPSTLRVVDIDSIPIPYALVSIDKAKSRAADTTGRVLLGPDERTELHVRAQRIGYKQHVGTINRPSLNDEFVVVLEPLARDLEIVRTVAPRNTPLSRTGFYDRMERVQKGAIVGEFIPPEEFEFRGGGIVSGILYGRRYVRVGKGGQLFGRGDCRMQIVLDGKVMVGATSIENMVHNREVMAIEIYPSTANAPVELIPLTFRGSCGIVALWTGSRDRP